VIDRPALSAAPTTHEEAGHHFKHLIDIQRNKIQLTIKGTRLYDYVLLLFFCITDDDDSDDSDDEVLSERATSKYQVDT
jgi:hypothetical protein